MGGDRYLGVGWNEIEVAVALRLCRSGHLAAVDAVALTMAAACRKISVNRTVASAAEVIMSDRTRAPPTDGRLVHILDHQGGRLRAAQP